MNIPARAVLIAILVHSLWGANPVAVKFGLLVFPPLWSAFIRFSIGILCIWVWARLNRIPIWPEQHEWFRLLLLGALFTCQIATMNIGISLTSGALASVLISTNPLFAAYFAHLWVSGDRLNPIKTLGLVIAFAGTALTLLQASTPESLALSNWGNWILLFSAALLGARLAFSANLLRRIDAVRVLIWQMAFSLPLFALGGWWWETIGWDNLGWQPLAGLAYQGLVIAGFGFMVNAYLMKSYRPSVIMSFNYVSPVSGVLLSLWLLGEAITWQLALGVLTVGLGLYLITLEIDSGG